MRVALFIPCFIDQLYPQVGQAMLRVLRRIGVDPALATGPFVTTTNDILGLAIYLFLTSYLRGWI